MAKSVNTILLVLAAVLLVPFASHAAGLGTLTVRSALGQPLDAEIEVVALRPGEELQVRLASREAYGVAGVDFSSALQGARFAIEKRDGKTVIRVRTTEPVNDPFLSVLVEVQLPSGRLARQYTVLVDPVEFRRAAAAPVPVAPPIAAAPAPVATPPIAAAAPAQAVVAAPSPAPVPAPSVVAVAPPAPSAPPVAVAPAAAATPTAPPVAVAPLQSAPVQPPVPPAAAAPAVVATPPVAAPAPASQPIAAAPAPAPAQPTIVTAPVAAPAESTLAAVTPPAAQTVVTPTLVQAAPPAPAAASVTPASPAPMVSTAPAAATEAVAAAAPTVQPASVAAAPQPQQAAAASVPAVAAAPLVQPAAPPASTAATQQGTEASDTYRIRRGDTLGGIARKWKPDGVTHEQMLVGLFQTNRPAFIRDNINLIRAGATLFIPGREDVLTIGAADAARQVRTHMAAFGRYRDTVVNAGVGSERITQAQREVISRRVGVKRSTRAM